MHRSFTGYTYGPKHGKTMQWYIDDLHLPLNSSPTADATSCSSHDYLRQLIDARGLYNLDKRNEWSVVEDFVIFGSLTSTSDALIEPRLRRHLAVVNVPDLQGQSLAIVVSQQLEALLGGVVSEEMLKKMVDSTIEVYRNVKQVLSVSDMAGRQHYLFSLKHLELVFQVKLLLRIPYYRLVSDRLHFAPISLHRASANVPKRIG